jgi:hypothetical protein
MFFYYFFVLLLQKENTSAVMHNILTKGYGIYKKTASSLKRFLFSHADINT